MTSGASRCARDLQRIFPRHVGIALAVQQAHRTGQRELLVEQRWLRPSSISFQVKTDGSGEYCDGRSSRPSRSQRGAILGRQALQQHALGEVGRGGDQHQAGQALGPRARHQQRQPAAHARAHQHQLAGGERVDRPPANCRASGRSCRPRSGPTTGRGRDSRSADRRGRSSSRPGFERHRLGAGHVGAEAAQERHRRRAARRSSHRRRCCRRGAAVAAL